VAAIGTTGGRFARAGWLATACVPLVVVLAVSFGAPRAVAGHPAGEVRALFPQDLEWGPNKTTPPGMLIAPLHGGPKKPGLFIFRAKFPTGYKLPPHRHPDERIVTVLSGTYYSGVGERFDAAKLVAYPAGSFYVTPAGVPHFAYVESGEVIIQESGYGPDSGIEYVDPSDDPRPH
jgi:quercetin dioxygenase-like cupin family protein